MDLDVVDEDVVRAIGGSQAPDRLPFELDDHRVSRIPSLFEQAVLAVVIPTPHGLDPGSTAGVVEPAGEGAVSFDGSSQDESRVALAHEERS